MGKRFEITGDTKLEDIIDRYPYVVPVLDEFGVYFDPFTYITLKSKLADVTGYNALNPNDSDSFIDAIRQAIDAGPPAEWKGNPSEQKTQ